MLKEMVSVVLPTYNRAYILDRAVKSVLMQTYPYFELIIVDDGSTDQTQELVAGYQDERIIYLKMQENRGQARARNCGIGHARYDYIAFQDSDDIWNPEKLSKQVDAMLSAPPEVGFTIKYDTTWGKVIQRFCRLKILDLRGNQGIFMRSFCMIIWCLVRLCLPKKNAF